MLLALHTLIGAGWKLSHSAETVPSLQAIPHGVWLSLSAVELLCGLGLILPAFNKSWALLAPIAALCIAAEMLLFSGVHLYSGHTPHGPLVYWLTVSALCAFIVYGRFVLRRA